MHSYVSIEYVSECVQFSTVHSLLAHGWLCDTIHIFSFSPISQQFISARPMGPGPGPAFWNPARTGRTRVPHKCKERAEKRKAEQQERGQEPGIKRGHLIHTSRITASQTERSLSVADTTELCSLSPPFHLHTHCPSLKLAAGKNQRVYSKFSVLGVFSKTMSYLKQFEKFVAFKHEEHSLHAM